MEQAGWEGKGPQPEDNPQPARDEANLMIALVAINDRIKSVTLDWAISALHAQRKPDGRPFVYNPESL